jgi:phage terminase large subunit-like protein
MALIVPTPTQRCSPRWATPRNPERRTIGGEIAFVAAKLGSPLMAWQREVADVTGEIDPETGRLFYRTVVVTVMRQQGKTTLTLPVWVQRALRWPAST